MALGGRNPFYLIELTRDYLDGKVQLPGLPTEAITLPISVRQLLEPRVKELGQDAANVAAHLAVWGRTLPLTDLAGLLGSGIESTVELVEELERCRLASVDLGMVGLAHELFRSTIYQGLSATRRSFLHGRVAEFQDRSEDPEPGEIAIHFAQAGNAPGAAHRGREAADRALESGAMAEAAYFLQVVVENVGDARLKAEATADLARVLHMNRDINRANPLLELASSRLRAVGNEALALRMDIRRVEGLAELGAAPLSELLDRLATIKALARAADDDEALALALDSELHLLHRSGKVSEIRTLFQEIRPLTSSRDQAAACLANAALALNVLFGDADEALRCAREAVRLADEGAAGRHMLHACSRLTLVLIYQGQLCTPEGQIVLSRATSIAQRSGDLTLRAYVELNQGVFAMEIGDFSQADEHFQKTENVLGQSLPGLPHVTLYYNQGELLLREGRYGEARQAFSRGESVCTAATPTYLVHLLSAGIGLSSLEVGDLSLARDRDALIRIDVGDPYFDPTIILDFRSRLMARRGHGDLVLDEIEAAAVAVRSRLPLVWLKLTLLAARLRRRLGLPPPSWATEALRIAESLPRYHLMDAFRGLRLQPR
jgi:tetratricopeptide (TPR) repeat protein